MPLHGQVGSRKESGGSRPYNGHTLSCAPVGLSYDGRLALEEISLEGTNGHGLAGDLLAVTVPFARVVADAADDLRKWQVTDDRFSGLVLQPA
jgi:hypothetical protein